MLKLSDYPALYRAAFVLPEKLPLVSARVAQITLHRALYDLVSTATGVPWWCIAAVHSLEASLKLTGHLHNGDPLTARTVHIPSGRPVKDPASGHFPYSWTESAIDALEPATPRRPLPWDLSSCFEYLERYNGLGYRERGLNSPYLWAATNQYEKGLFVSDGKFNPEARSEQIGAAAILKSLESQGMVALQ